MDDRDSEGMRPSAQGPVPYLRLADPAGDLVVPDGAEAHGRPERDAHEEPGIFLPASAATLLLWPRAPAPEAAAGHGGSHLHRIAAIVSAQTGWDFEGYRPSTLERRLAQRMRAVGVASQAVYLRLLERRPDEVRALADRLLAPVTTFFRDRALFGEIERVVIPRIFDRLGPTEPLRAWSVGCGTGEEPYSLAILLHEEAARRGVRVPIRVFATDMHAASLSRARAGLYPRGIEAHVTAERLARFFHEEPGGYRVDRRIRDSIIFTTHDVLTDPPFSHIDLIACHNLLIDLQPPLKRQAIERFHYALRPGGDLVLGTCQAVELEDLFGAAKPRQSIYSRRDVRGARPTLAMAPLAGRRSPERSLTPPPSAIDHGALHERMILASAPATVLVSPGDRVVHVSPGADGYLTYGAGPPTTNVHALVRAELLPELGVLLVAARAGRGGIEARPVTLDPAADGRVVRMRARASDADDPGGYVLLTFEELACEARVEPLGHERHDVHALELELERARLTIRALTETYQAGQEDLEASNCELQSANEELRSALEELEARKEELRHVNEDLRRLDLHHRRRVAELDRVSRDLEHVLAATDVATLFLDRDLRIVRFTPAAHRIFNVQPADRGRPLADFTHSLEHAGLGVDISAALLRDATIEREVRDARGCWYLLRVMRHPSVADAIGGVVVTLVDITDRKRLEELVPSRG